MQRIADKNSATMAIAPNPSGRGYRLEASQFLPQPRERVFEFFADAFELETLTPSWLHFSVLTPAPIQIAPGTLIDYRLRLRGIPLRWQSVISAWEPPFRFVDEQTRGPYRRWHHEHQFEATDEGTLCRDIVDYEVYGGALINSLAVRHDLLKIFSFRQDKLRDFFGR
jgi:ligand-binding SRPBCC domain-containing protein